MTKITFIGAGSVGFTRGLVRDVLTFPLLADATITLMDIDPDRLDFARRSVERIIELGKSELERELQKAKTELKSQIAIIALNGAEKILGHNIDKAANSDLIDKLITEI